MNIYKFRDLTMIDINKDQTLVISCDSAGGIGNKEQDIVKTSEEILGYYTSSVALMEVLSCGAQPITLVNNLCVEMNPSGIEIIKGIKRALMPLDVDYDSIITGSTEENIKVKSSGLGVTVVGIVNTRDMRVKNSNINDLIVSIGEPKVGDEVILDKEKTIMNTKRLVNILALDIIKEILPVGSKGIGYEAMELAKSNELSIEFFTSLDVDIEKTAGPATCILASLKESDYEKLVNQIDIKVSKIGYLKGW